MTDAPSFIRQGTENDIPFMTALFQEAYPARGIERGLPWMKWAMGNVDRLVLVGAHSAGVACVSWNYGFEPKGRLDILAARPAARGFLEPFRMLGMMIQWAKLRGAVGTFKIEADTGVDFGPFARRLGGQPVTRTWYEIPLENV